jgi:hypothetical protein
VDGCAAVGEGGCDALSDGVAPAGVSVCAGSLSLDLITFDAAVATAEANWGVALG